MPRSRSRRPAERRSAPGRTPAPRATPLAGTNVERDRDPKAVLLDLDDTLVLEESHAMAQIRATARLVGVDPYVWEKAVISNARGAWHSHELSDVCRELGISSWEGLWATFEGCHPRLAPVKDLVETYRARVWSTALREVGQESVRDGDLVQELSRTYVASQRAGHPLAPGARLLVERARAVGPIALVTNGPPDVQRLKLSQTAMAEMFDAVVISGELGLGKPDPEVFHHATRSLGVAHDRAVMVGDSWERDIEGALEAGLRAVWLSHGRPAPKSDARVATARSAGEVVFD